MTKRERIIRAPHDRDNAYFICSRATPQDERLSWEARGVMWYLLSKPDTWELQPKDLEQQCGRDKVKKILKELETFGYIKKSEQGRGERHKFASITYEVYERPLTENPSTVKPSTVAPLTENPSHRELENRELENEIVAPIGAANAIVDETPQPPNVVAFKPTEQPQKTKREPKAFEDVPKSDRLAIIQAWYDALAVKPSIFNTDANHNAAAAIRRDGYSAGHVARYVKAQMNDGYWIGKTLSLTKVAELMPAWIAAHAPKTTNHELMQAIREQVAKAEHKGFGLDQFVRDTPDDEVKPDVA